MTVKVLVVLLSSLYSCFVASTNDPLLSRQATRESTGSVLSLVLLGSGRGGGGDETQVEGVDIVKGVGRALQPSPSWAENTIMTKSTQESGHRQSTYVLSPLWPQPRPCTATKNPFICSQFLHSRVYERFICMFKLA